MEMQRRHPNLSQARWRADFSCLRPASPIKLTSFFSSLNRAFTDPTTIVYGTLVFLRPISVGAHSGVHSLKAHHDSPFLVLPVSGLILFHLVTGAGSLTAVDPAFGWSDHVFLV